MAELREGVSRKMAHVTALLAHSQDATARLESHEVRECRT